MWRPYKIYLFNQEEVDLILSLISKQRTISLEKKDSELCTQLKNLENKIYKRLKA